MFIWKIEIYGNEHVPKEEIARYIQKCNVGYGDYKKNIDCNNLEMGLREEFKEIIWASITLTGTKLEVHVKENIINTKKEQPVNENEGFHIIASRDATIINMITRKGVPLVQVGEKVKKGQILIQGMTPILNDNKEMVDAHLCYGDGNIIGITTRKDVICIPREYEKKIYSGKKKTSFKFSFGNGKKIGIHYKKPFSYWDETTSYVQLRLGKNLYLPFSYEKTTYYDYKMKQDIYEKKELQELAKQKIHKYEENLRKNKVQILENNDMIDIDKKQCNIFLSYKTSEEIGILRKVTEEEQKKMNMEIIKEEEKNHE